jgi:phytoene synthase
MNRAQTVAGARDAINQGSKSFRAASRLFDPVTRERAWLLYCWCRHCDDLCDGQTYGFGPGERCDVEVLRSKTLRAAGGETLPEVPFQALAQLLRESPIPRRLLEDHLEGFFLDESGWEPRTEEDLIRYCYHVAGAVGCMMAIVMGVPASDQDTLERAADLGIAFQLSNIARDLREDHEAGRCYLPRRWLEEFGVERSDLFALSNRPVLLKLADRLVANVELYEDSARRGLDRLGFRSRLAVLTALRIYGAIGRRVTSLGATAWDERVSVGKLTKLAYLVPSLAEATLVGRR